MKKKIARIQFWLNRLSVACEKGNWPSALIEADSLSAETREVREELWNIAESGGTREKAGYFRIKRNAMIMRSTFIAVVLLLALSASSDTQADRLLDSPAPQNIAKEAAGTQHLTWVSTEEEDLLKIMRAELNKVAGAAPAATKKNAPAAAAFKKSAVAALPAPKQASPDTQKTKLWEREIGEDELIALVQIGEKAFRRSSPAIKIIK